MKKIIDLLRFVFISPELIGGITIYFLLSGFLFVPTFISKYLFSDNVDVKWVLFGVTLPVMWYIYKFGDEILNPSNDTNRKILKEFPKYWMLRNRIYYSIVVSIIAFSSTLFAFYYAYNFDRVNGTIILLTSWFVVLVCFMSVALAKLSIKDILY